MSSQLALKQSKAGILWLTHLGVQGPTGRRAGALPSSSPAVERGGGGAKSPRPATRLSSVTRRADGADTGPDLRNRNRPSRPQPPGADRAVPAGRGSPGHVAGRAQHGGAYGAGRGERGAAAPRPGLPEHSELCLRTPFSLAPSSGALPQGAPVRLLLSRSTS